MWDCIVIGSGIAGISAALTLQANGKNFLLFGKKSLSDKIEKAEKIHNYPGLSDVSGKAFVAALQAQLQAANIDIVEEKVSGVYALKEKFTVLTQTGQTYEAKTVILACGVEATGVIDGETELNGRGVSYCATCDGFLYKGKTIAVVCTSKKAEHEIEYLANFAKKVYLIPLYKNVEIERENVEIILKKPKRIEGKMRVERLVFAAQNGETVLPIDGVFMLRESIAPAVLIGGLQTEEGHVVVDRRMATNLHGCFAAGDCTGRPYQYTKAAGEGNIAAHAASEYLRNR